MPQVHAYAAETTLGMASRLLLSYFRCWCDACVAANPAACWSHEGAGGAPLESNHRQAGG